MAFFLALPENIDYEYLDVFLKTDLKFERFVYFVDTNGGGGGIPSLELLFWDSLKVLTSLTQTI